MDTLPSRFCSARVRCRHKHAPRLAALRLVSTGRGMSPCLGLAETRPRGPAGLSSGRKRRASARSAAEGGWEEPDEWAFTAMLTLEDATGELQVQRT